MHQYLQISNNMYLRIINDTINYPYTINELRNSYPNTSLPSQLTDESLVEWDMYVVTPTPAPSDYTKNITEDTPTLIDGNYYQTWNQVNASEAEISYRIENQWEEVRVLRNQLLTECDWTQLADISSEIKEAWTVYRQALRNITTQTNPFNIEWPAKP
jgi:hypothetical protein